MINFRGTALFRRLIRRPTILSKVYGPGHVVLSCMWVFYKMPEFGDIFRHDRVAVLPVFDFFHRIW